MRMDKMITKGNLLWSFNKLSKLILQENVWRSVRRIWILIFGLQGLRRFHLNVNTRPISLNGTFRLALFIALYSMVIDLVSINEILKCDHIQMKAVEQYFPVVLFSKLYNVF